MGMTCDRVRELASGFVLGALDTNEMIAVADHLDSCAREHPEIDEFGGVLPYLVESLEPVEPPSWLRESVIAAAKADLAATRRIGQPSERRDYEPVAMIVPMTAPEAAPAAAAITSIAKVRVSRRRRALTWSMRVAAAVAIVVLTGAGVVVQGNLDKAAKSQNEDKTLVNALIQNDTRSATLSPAGDSKAAGIAAVMPTGHIILKLYGLAPTSNDEVYVVWLTTDKGGPTKVGSFTPEDTGVGWLDVENVPTSASLWIYVSKEPNDKGTTRLGPVIVSGMVSI
jgi:nitroreductase